MNTKSFLKPASLSVGLLFATLFASNAIAGPGPQYWAAQGKPKADPVAKADVAPVTLCAGAEVVTDTIMKPAMANGKGPLVATKIGTKTVCHMCPVTTVVTRNSLPNGKGTPVTTEVTKVGAEHNCAKCTGTPVKA
ncbi:hypothetical protein K0B96_16240 [Horticoccus luteus]|uniref:Uncharacterized protein n=1 Tax=Horticoccus luteus TaxID=2862869 RepID=A0A8F9XG67_9BACT|nr:hypothetical protein [Horticoccus luteus]QYM78832.1 hypothetical protein K0B96_16240 [Horticoccus luteus]